MLKFDIAGHRKIWFLISALIIIPGLICMAVRGFNFGIDFTGGRNYVVRFEKPVDAEKIEAVTAEIEGVSVANYNCPGQIVITGKTKAVEKGYALGV